MARRLADNGNELVVWGRDRRRLEPFLHRGAIEAASPADLARRVEAIFLCVTDTNAVEQVVFGDDGVAAGISRGAVLVDHSTIHPERTRELAARLRAERGASWVDAPVSGGAPGARAGTLVIFAGGAPEDEARVRPWLSSYASRITWLGPNGSGQAGKSVNQAVFGATLAIWVEALEYTRRIGLDPGKLVAATEGSWSDSPVRKYFGRHLVSGHTVGGRRPGRGLMTKDLQIVLELARAAGAEVPLIEVAARILSDSTPESPERSAEPASTKKGDA